jgi:SET domain-containing protein
VSGEDQDGEPNISVAEVMVDGRPMLIFFTCKDVKKEEEFTLDYGQEYWDNYCRNLALIKEHSHHPASQRPRLR